jgi:preprotein translocase subunit SecG
MIYALLIVVHVIVSLVLIIVILLQAGRGGGLSETFGLSSTQTFFGTSAAKFLQNATSVCAVLFLLTCLGLAALSTHRSRSLMERQRVRKVVEDLAMEEKEKSQVIVDKKAEPLGAEETKGEEANAGQSLQAEAAKEQVPSLPIGEEKR